MQKSRRNISAFVDIYDIYKNDIYRLMSNPLKLNV